MKKCIWSKDEKMRMRKCIGSKDEPMRNEEVYRE